MNTTKYSVSLIDKNSGEEPVALLSSKLCFDAIRLICNACVDDYTKQRAVAIDMDTGEVVYDTDDEESYYPDVYEPFDGQYDELNYDPYMGCDFYDCPTVDDFFCDY